MRSSLATWTTSWSDVIDRDGVVRACFIGARTYADFEREVTKCMGAPHVT